MRVLEYGQLDPRSVEGIKGALTALDVVSEDGWGVGIRIVPPNAKVPKPGTPYAKGRRVLFALRGAGTVSNGEYYEKINAGKFIILDEGETPSYMTQDDELVLLEIRYDGAGKVSAAPMATMVPTSMDVKTARVTTYDAVD